ncbi:Serine/threonine-protein kinase PknK [compost metagenome]
MALERDPEPERFLSTFSGSDAAIAEFLAEDVLDRQPEPLRDFLLRSSVLKQMQASLCDAVLERDDSAEMLAQLSRGNLFLMSTDNLGNFRYHALFADFLRARLMQCEPGRVPGLHLRAARWYEAQGRPVPAIEHALHAGDEELVVRLLGAHAQPLLDAGRFRLLARWIGSLPTALVDAHPRLRIIEAWALTYINRGEQARTLLDRLEAQRVQRGEAEDDEVRANILALRPLLMMFRDEPGGFAAALRNQSQLSPRHGFPYSQLSNVLAVGHAAVDEYDTARTLLAGARRLHREIGSTFGLVYAECLEGSISLRQGHLQDALTRLRGAMNHMAGDDTRRVDRNPIAAVMYAEALYESGQPDQAERLLNIYLPQVRETGMIDVEARGYLTLARITWRPGGQEQAFDLLADLERHGQQDNLARSLICADLERARLELLRGDAQASAASLARAQAYAEQYQWSDCVQPLHDVESLPLARLRLRLHGVTDSATAAALLAELDEAIQAARTRQRHRLALHLTLLRIDALRRSGRLQEAQVGLAEALAGAAAQCIVQPFAEEGSALAGLALAWMQSPEGRAKLQAPELAAFSERLEAACIAAGGRPESLPAPAPRAPTIQLEEGFTRRELDVLNLLVQGKSNDQVAQQLFVSRNTVRTHVRNILGKLGVSNRTEAVVAAHQQGLVG